MLKVQIWSHKDGDHLAIVEVPWWHDIADWCINTALCPCHGVSGFLSRWEPIEVLFYRIWNHLLGYLWRKEQHLYQVPVNSACTARRAIFNKDEPCWRDDCPHCWHLQDDAFTSKATDEVLQ